MIKYTSSGAGFVTFTFGMYVVGKDVHLGGVSHHTNAILGGSLIAVGLCFMFPVTTINVIKSIVAVIGPYLPKVNIGKKDDEDGGVG